MEQTKLSYCASNRKIYGCGVSICVVILFFGHWKLKSCFKTISRLDSCQGFVYNNHKELSQTKVKPGRLVTRSTGAQCDAPYFYVMEGGENVEAVLDVIISFIQNVGFPIACVVAMFWMWDRER